MSDIDKQRKRQAQLARTLIRLKHKWNADDEIEVYLEAEKAAIQNGLLARLDTNLKELLGDS